jgi:5-methylcytosine-specific restriction endonuclease McrA
LLCPTCNKKKGARVTATSTRTKAKSIAGKKKSSGVKAKTTRRRK